MSRLTRWASGFLLKGSAPRTYAETLLVFVLLVLLTILIYEDRAAQLYVTSLMFFIGPCAALYYALRLRIPQGRWYRRLLVDIFWLSIPAFLANGLLWGVARLALDDSLGFGELNTALDLLFLALFAFPYVFFRAAVRVLVWWNYLRQRRVMWALVSSHLIAVAILQALVLVPSALVFLAATNTGENAYTVAPATPLAQFAYRLQMTLPMVGLAILGVTAVLFTVLPVSIVVSFFFARRIRRRLDTLIDAAHTARDGDYSVRIPVSGQDEIAKLQTDFNAMATNLEQNVNALRDEQEKVSALLKTRRELMASVSHELRTPIATIRAYLDSTIRQHGQTDKLAISASDLEIIQRETQRLQTLIDDLFALSRAEVDQLALQCEPMDAVSVIERVVETVAPLAWRINRIEIVADTPSWLPLVTADESRLEQVLRNLVHNSLRHTPPGGVVVISAREVEDKAQIQVRDTGEGIAADDLPHIWERYYRNGVNGGTGLGLTLVKSFTEAMGGQVAVDSQPGEGACFTLMLPLSSTTAAETEVPKLPEPQPVPHTPLVRISTK